MDTEMEIDPEIAAMMGFGSFGGSKKRKFGADEAFTDAQPAGGKTQEPQQVVSNANSVPVAEARTSRPANAPIAGKFRWSRCSERSLNRSCRHYTQRYHTGGWVDDELPSITTWHLRRAWRHGLLSAEFPGGSVGEACGEASMKKQDLLRVHRPTRTAHRWPSFYAISAHK